MKFASRTARRAALDGGEIHVVERSLSSEPQKWVVYASGWHAIGTTMNGTSNVETSSGNYSFAMAYRGSRQQLDEQTAGANADVVSRQEACIR